MPFDWQAVAVAIIILCALFYAARRGYARLRSFGKGSHGAAASCETGCGKCGDEVTQARPANVPVQITSHRSGARRG